MKRFILFLALTFLFSCKKAEQESPVIKGPNTTGNETGSGIDEHLEDVTATPGVLPKHIAFGTEGDISQKNNFINETDYQYQYLAGDIFSHGWTTWNSPSGQFARAFLSGTGRMGKVPVFTYYNIVPAKGRFEDPGFRNLNDAEVMNKYFEDWKFLLQICKEYGKTVIIHYEPDLFGYMQMFKADQTKKRIMVSKSGNADARGFSDDAKGLAQAIVSMRNKYASNVLLGWHASQWATGIDLIKGKGDPEQLAAETAGYYKSLNATFDLIFSEFSDRDSGYEEVVNRKNVIWSMTGSAVNGNLSDFDRFQRFLKKMNQLTQRKIILWQIPIGNSLTRSCNNLRGHYKDNKAEYFLQPVADRGNLDRLVSYGKAGVIAFLFGRGASDCTSFMDSRGDGVTAANETADDDGGYLRRSIKTYYSKGPVPLP